MAQAGEGGGRGTRARPASPQPCSLIGKLELQLEPLSKVWLSVTRPLQPLAFSYSSTVMAPLRQEALSMLEPRLPSSMARTHWPALRLWRSVALALQPFS